MNEEVTFDIKIDDMDLSFVKELVDGGISDDTSSLVGDVSFSDDDVTIDYNHPLAGKTLMFSVTLLDVRAATEDEIASGVIGGHSHEGGCCGGGHCDTAEPEPVKNDSCCGGGHCS